MAQIVLSDATPLIYLAQIPDGLSWLEKLFGYVVMTPAVKKDVLPGEGKPGEREIEDAVRRGILRVLENDWPSPRFPWLDEGEETTIRAAVNLVELGHTCLVIIDEKDGRNTIKELASAAITVSGTAAVVGRAKELGLIPSASAVFEELRQRGFRISDDVVRLILEKVGEAAAQAPAVAAKAALPKAPKARRKR
ncbi:MAG: DUF3368 domain-containing protein [Candidatus Binataceae bacterium]